MHTVISIVLPLLFIAMTGFLLVRAGIMSADQINGLAAFLVKIAIPALLVGSLASLNIREVLERSFMFAYLSIGFTLSVLVWFIVRYGLGREGASATTAALAVAIPNNIILGYPLSVQVYGDAALPVFAAVILIENMIYLPLAYLMYESSAHRGVFKCRTLLTIAWRVAANPVSMAVAVGLACAYWSFGLPTDLAQALTMLSSGVTGIALFTIGGTLASASSAAVSPELGVSVVVRLLIAPLLAVTTSEFIFGLSDIETGLLTLLCASPCFTILPAISGPYGAGLLGARIQIVGTVLALITLPVVLYYLAVMLPKV